MDIEPAFVAYGQTADAVDPGECAFDDPPVLAQLLAALDAAARDPGPDAAPEAGVAAAAMIVGLVGVQLSAFSNGHIDVCVAEPLEGTGRLPRATSAASWLILPSRAPLPFQYVAGYEGSQYSNEIRFVLLWSLDRPACIRDKMRAAWHAAVETTATYYRGKIMPDDTRLSEREYLQRIHRETGVLREAFDTLQPDLCERLEALRCLTEGLSDQRLILKTQEYMVMKLRDLLRKIGMDRTQNQEITTLISTLSGYSFAPSPVTFVNSLPLLTLVSAILVRRESWRMLGKDMLLKQDAVKACRAATDRFDAEGASQDFYYFIARAITEHAAGGSDISDDLFKQAAKVFFHQDLRADRHLIPDYQGAFNTFSSEDIFLRVPEGEPAPLSMTLHKQASQTGSHVVISAVDCSYFRRFVPHAAASFLDQDETGIYHVHLVTSSTEAALEAIEMLGDLREHPRLAVSFSPDLVGGGSRAYYTMVRYFFLRQIRDVYALPTFVTDVDLVYTRSLARMAQEFSQRGYHVGVYATGRMGRCIPWFALSCTFLYISNDAMGNYFAERLSKSAQFFFGDVGSVKYNIDQNLLYSLIRLMQDRMPGFVRCNMKVVEALPYKSLNKSRYPDPAAARSAAVEAV